MRLLLFGRYGQLGWELHRTLAPLGQVFAYDLPEIELGNAAQLRQVIHATQPDVIVNAAAYTAVDRAESQPELALAVNAHAPRLMAQEALAVGAALVHYSTDYVFDGLKGSDYLETDPPNPRGVYGQSKLQGEIAIQQVGGACLILRTSWVYSLRRESFVTRVLSWARQQPSMSVVADQIGNPTWARMLAETSAQLLALGRRDLTGFFQEHSGLYHLAGSGRASRLEWAQAILRFDPMSAEQIVEQLLPARTVDFPSPALRPLYSALDCSLFQRTFALSLPPWQDALQLCMET